jgi:hypothetical protein
MVVERGESVMTTHIGHMRWLHSKNLDESKFFQPSDGESQEDFQTRFIRHIFSRIKNDKIFTNFLEEGESQGDRWTHYEEDMKDINFDDPNEFWDSREDYNENMLNELYDFCDGERIRLD